MGVRRTQQRVGENLVPRYSPRTGELQEYQVGPFDSTHLYVQWGGKLPGGEQWSCGFRMGKVGGSTEADAVSALVPVSAALAEFHVRTGTKINSKAKLSFVKVNAISLAGTYQGSGTNEATFADTPGGLTVMNGTSFPNQIALAVSLTTGFSRGPAHRGRFYLPLPVLDIDADGVASEAACDEIDASCVLLRTAVNSTGHAMWVMSRKAGAPGHREVTGFEVGRVLDTQRRRRRSLPENYQ